MKKSAHTISAFINKIRKKLTAFSAVDEDRGNVMCGNYSNDCLKM